MNHPEFSCCYQISSGRFAAKKSKYVGHDQLYHVGFIPFSNFSFVVSIFIAEEGAVVPCFWKPSILDAARPLFRFSVPVSIISGPWFLALMGVMRMVRESPDHLERSHRFYASLARLHVIPPVERTVFNSLQAFHPPKSLTAGSARLHWQKEWRKSPRIFSWVSGP